MLSFYVVSLLEAPAQAEELASEGRQVGLLVESLHPINPIQAILCIRF